jgi:hypothetical protein
VDHNDAELTPMSVDTATSRRRMITTLLAGGAAVAVAPLLASGASAASGSPTRDEADFGPLNAGLERETRMVATCLAAVNATSNADDKAALKLIHDHHVAYVQALTGALGTAAAVGSSAPLADMGGGITLIAGTLARLEEETIDAHLSILAQLRGTSAAALVASIITVEARHVAALGLVSGQSPATAAAL